MKVAQSKLITHINCLAEKINVIHTNFLLEI